MKKMAAFPLLLALMLLAGCNSWLFHLVATIDKTAVFPVDQTGGFEKFVTITSEDVLNALDLPDDARVTGVDIEGLSLRVILKPGNNASRLRLTGEVYDVAQDKSKMFENYEVVIAGADEFGGINDLIALGIGKLRGKLEGFIKKLDTTSFFIELSGDSVPPGQRVALNVELKIRATIKYDQCLPMPLGFTSDEECSE